MSNTNYTEQVKEGLKTTISIPVIGNLFQDTLQSLAVKINEEISGTFGLTELDNLILVPRVAKNATGATEIGAFAYFSTTNPQGNIFYRGKGNNRVEGGRINMVTSAGIAGGGTGPFGTSQLFNQVIKPLCKVGDNGKPILNIKTVPGTNGVAAVELDFNALLCLALGIKPNDQYDFDIINVSPIPNTTNYTIVFTKYIVSNGVRKGRNSQINYARIEQDQFRRLNGGGNNNNGRSY